MRICPLHLVEDLLLPLPQLFGGIQALLPGGLELASLAAFVAVEPLQQLARLGDQVRELVRAPKLGQVFLSGGRVPFGAQPAAGAFLPDGRGKGLIEIRVAAGKYPLMASSWKMVSARSDSAL